MTETFTASNGIELRVNANGWVERRNSSEIGTGRWDEILGINVKRPALVLDAIREFFQHERDKELGRWRWQEKPDYVVYPSDLYLTPPNLDLVTVFNERTGQSSHCRREDDGNCGHFSFAARAYFAAHPEPKPWHDAKPGEIWIITTENVADEVAVQVTPEGTFQYNDGFAWPILGMPILTGRRIFPEVVSDA